MQGSNLENITPDLSNTNSSSDAPTIVQTDVGAKDGQNKCPKCGATDISLNINTGKLRCNFCRHEFEPIKVEGLQTDISKLEGQIIGSGHKILLQILMMLLHSNVIVVVLKL